MYVHMYVCHTYSDMAFPTNLLMINAPSYYVAVSLHLDGPLEDPDHHSDFPACREK
jgi:hypothetical protein